MEPVDNLKAVTLRLKIEAQLPSELPSEEVQKTQDQEIEFIYGIERQAPTLEKALKGVTAGHRFNLVIPPEELYGVHDPQLVREIPKEGLIKQRVREGRYYRQIKMGSLVEFKVLDIKDDTVLVDFNGPMAGVSASMEGEVLSVRRASEDEIEKAQERERKKGIGCS